MERRQSRRHHIFINAEIISGGKSYTGVLGDISETGLYVSIRSADSGIKFTPKTIFYIEFKTPSEETLKLHCRLTWSYEISIVKSLRKSAYNLGMEITETCPGYEEFYENVAMMKLNEQIDQINNK